MSIWEKLGHWYYVFWHDFLCRVEPFTYQFRRMAKKWPIFWLVFVSVSIIALAVYICYRIVKWKWFWWILFSGVVFFFVWLLLHLGGFA